VDEVALTNAGSERVKLRNEQLNNEAAYFLAALFFSAVECLWNGGRYDRLEQPNETKGTTGERPLDGL
jgi:hypothetical protein